MELQDQRVLVTGATAGIGQETAKLFARRGASVIISGRDTERGTQTVAAIEAEGGRAEFIAADLNDIESVRRLAEQTGDVDVLINNAATVTADPTLEQDVESFDMTFDVELVRVIRLPPVPGDLTSPPKEAKKTKSGLAYNLLAEGTGKVHPSKSARVEIRYAMWSLDGKMVENSFCPRSNIAAIYYSRFLRV